tara:strand:- start:900 stop:1559 length:660 start_codon:yes stop_codon:yes gene_type:complete
MLQKKSHVNNQIEMNKTIQKKKPKRITKRNCKQDLLMQSLITFFSNKKNINIILSIIEGKSKISLRLIDWFVTNYCKKNTVRYYINKKGLPKKQIDVHLNYKTQLKSFSKKQFDPFRRDERILFEYDNEKKLTLTTTVGQLNFFRWVIKNNILIYIEKNLKSIEKDMNSITKKNRIKYLKDKEQKTTKNKKPIRKRRQLCVSATKTISKHVATITVNFN